MTPSPQNPSTDLHVGRSFVALWITLTVLIFALALALLARNWLVHDEPSSVLVLDGSPALKGAQARVVGSDNVAPLVSTFDDENGYSLRFYLDAGTHQFQIVW